MTSWRIVLLFLNDIVIALADQTNIVYINETKNWTEAKHTCRERFGGFLATINLNDSSQITQLKSCMMKEAVWVGHYTVVTKFISVNGCYNSSRIEGNETMLDKVSANACQLRCGMMYFAVEGRSCTCLKEKPNATLNISMSSCNIKCVDRGMCGGNGVVTVYYASIRDASDYQNDFPCRQFSCPDETKKNFTATKCSQENKFSCETGKLVQKTPLDWESAVKHCANNGSTITKKPFCPEIDNAIAYWSSDFRGEEYIFDADNIKGEPNRVAILKPDGNSFELTYKKSNEKGHKGPFLCELVYNYTQNENDSLLFCKEEPGLQTTTKETTSCQHCQPTSTGNAVNVIKHASTIGDIDETKSQVFDVDYTKTSSNSSKVRLILGIVSGCVFVIIIIIIIVAIIAMKTRLRSKEKHGAENTGRLNATVNNCTYGTYNGIENDRGGRDQAEFIEVQEGVYDHLREQENRRMAQEDIYSHAHSHNDDVDLYDISSHNRKQIHDDNDEAYSRFVKPEGIYD